MESSKASTGGNWTGCLHFWNGEKTTQVPADEVLHFFRNRLQAEKEIIKFAEIRKYSLVKQSETPVCGLWHEYTLAQSTNYWWSFEKMSSGIHVQKSKNKEDVQCAFGGEPRNKDRPEGRSAMVSHGENILDVAKWIIMRYVSFQDCQTAGIWDLDVLANPHAASVWGDHLNRIEYVSFKTPYGIYRNELGNPYHVTKRNCHYFASLLYEAIVRKEGRRLDNTV